MTQAEKITRLLERRQISQQHFARLCDQDKHWASDLTRGRYRIAKSETLLLAADALGVPADYLLRDDQGWPPPIHNAVLTDDELRILGNVRKMGVEAVDRRLLAEMSEPAQPGRPAEFKLPSPSAAKRTNNKSG